MVTLYDSKQSVKSTRSFGRGLVVVVRLQNPQSLESCPYDPPSDADREWWRRECEKREQARVAAEIAAFNAWLNEQAEDFEHSHQMCPYM